ncbi:MAG: hypothetical protein WCL30_01045 [Pseudomonadota bacterium]
MKTANNKFELLKYIYKVLIAKQIVMTLSLDSCAWLLNKEVYRSGRSFLVKFSGEDITKETFDSAVLDLENLTNQHVQTLLEHETKELKIRFSEEAILFAAEQLKKDKNND